MLLHVVISIEYKTSLLQDVTGDHPIVSFRHPWHIPLAGEVFVLPNSFPPRALTFSHRFRLMPRQSAKRSGNLRSGKCDPRTYQPSPSPWTTDNAGTFVACLTVPSTSTELNNERNKTRTPSFLQRPTEQGKTKLNRYASFSIPHQNI